MTIQGVNGNGAQAQQAGGIRADDAVSKNIQRQIADVQKKLQELSSNDHMSTEEKMKKRQELQKQIYDLQNQLRQHEIQKRRESQKAQESSMDGMLGGKHETDRQQDTVGISEAGMKAMISADSSIKLAKSQEKLATEFKGQARTLRGEMNLDRPEIAEKKKEELAELEEKALNAEATEGRILGSAVKEREEASKEGDAGTARADKEDREEEKSVIGDAEQEQKEDMVAYGAGVYKPVDILL